MSEYVRRTRPSPTSRWRSPRAGDPDLQRRTRRARRRHPARRPPTSACRWSASRCSIARATSRSTSTPTASQNEAPVEWSPEERARAAADARPPSRSKGARCTSGRGATTVRGVSGHDVPVSCSTPRSRRTRESTSTLTDALYGGDSDYRLCQEVVLGMGGAAMLRALGFDGASITTSTKGTPRCSRSRSSSGSSTGAGDSEVDEADVAAVRRQLRVHDAHAGPGGTRQVSARRWYARPRRAAGRSCCATPRALDGDMLNMTLLALRFSRFANAVAMRHQEVSREMFPQYAIESITNGVHARDWTSAPFRQLFDRHIPRVAARQSLPALRGRAFRSTRSATRTPRRRERCCRSRSAAPGPARSRR